MRGYPRGPRVHIGTRARIVDDPYYKIMNGMEGIIVDTFIFNEKTFYVLEAENEGPWMENKEGARKRVRAWHPGNIRYAHASSLKKTGSDKTPS